MSNSPIASKSAAALAAQLAAQRAAEAARRAAEAAARQAAAQAAAAAARAATQASRSSPQGLQQRAAQLVERVRSEAAPVNLRGDSAAAGVRHAGGLTPSALQALLQGNKPPTYDVRGANRHMEGFRYAPEGAGTTVLDSIVAMELNGGRVDYGKDNALNCTQATVVAQDSFHAQTPPVETEIVVGNEHAVLRMPDGRYYDPSRAIVGEDPFLTPEQAAPYQGVDGVSLAEREELAASARQAMEALPPGASEEERRRVGTAAARREALTLGSDGQVGEASASQRANLFGVGLDDITDPIGDVWGALVDGAGDVATAGVDVLQHGGDFVLDQGGRLVEGVLELTTDAGTFIADAGAGTIDFVGDVAEGGWDAVSNAVQLASEHGLKLTGKLAEEARALARDGLLGPLDIPGNVSQLGVGDSYTFGLGGEVSGGVSVGAAGEISIKRSQEDGQDSYTVSASLEVDLGLTIPGATATVGVGGKVEYTFDNPEDAARAAEIIAMAAAAKAMEAASPGLKPLADAMMPSQEDMDFLNGNMSAVELSGEGALSVSAELGIGDAFGVSGSAEVGGAVRVEFVDGQPAFVEVKASAELSASGSFSVPLAGGPDGQNLPGGEVSGSAEVERTYRYPIKPGTTLDELIANPGSSVDRTQGEVTTTLTVEGSASGGGNDAGVKVTIDISNIPPEELNGYIADVLRGNPGPLLQALEEQPRTTEHYVDSGVDASPEVKVGGMGFQLNVKSEIRDVEPGLAA